MRALFWGRNSIVNFDGLHLLRFKHSAKKNVFLYYLEGGDSRSGIHFIHSNIRPRPFPSELVVGTAFVTLQTFLEATYINK